MAINFISDLHLDKSRPHINKYFIEYLYHLDNGVTDLYILGDLFEYWVGDDDPMDGLEEVREAITYLGGKINIWYMHGNRDFLVTKSICKDLKINLLDDPTVIEIDNVKILLLHGDTLCTDDHEYQNFRSLVRSSTWQKEMLSKSLEERLTIADNLRKKSIEANRLKGEEIMDVNNTEVMNIIQKYTPDVIIHGHTHRPNIHRHNEVIRYVLGDWYNNFFILTYDDDKFYINKGFLK
ncbi:MAG: UDP-2,3-diacylglucosamine diphosphatase [Pseudomonadota bacterium]|nr:UDP-2,3-diacylglucosamine diphosphatase [Pseudomonadota bacterium]